MDKKKLMKQDDYCYACVAVTSTGQEHICGFSKTFAGLKDVRDAYIEACQAENIDDMSFTTPEPWSRTNIIDFFTGLKERNVKWAYLLHGFIPGEDKIFLNTPDDIESFLSLKELYENENE